MNRSAITVLALLYLVACGAKKPDAAGGGKGRKNLTFAVDSTPVQSKRVPYVISAPGSIDAFERVQVTARVPGAVDRVAFTEGQEVKKGDTLVVIDSERYRLAVNAARAAVAKADASLKDSQAMVTRREGASETNPGLIPGEELASTKTKVLTAQADREVAVQQLRGAELDLRSSSVTAPLDGVIQTRTIETGQYVPAGYVMATLLRSEPLLLRFQVEPLEAPRIRPGTVASFTMRETNRKFDAKITLVAGAADPATHLVPITAEVAEVDHKYWLRPGSFCDVTITLDADREAPLIPRTAARATDHGYVAYVLDGTTAHEHVVTLGMSTKDGWVEVRSGLKAGDMLVVRGAEALTEGTTVQANEVTAESLLHADADAGAPAAPQTPPSPDPTPPEATPAPASASASGPAAHAKPNAKAKAPR